MASVRSGAIDVRALGSTHPAIRAQGPGTLVDVRDASGTQVFAVDQTGISVGIASNAWEFKPEDYGAVGDNSTDDTTAINNCIAAAVAWATGASGNYYAEIIFSPSKTYVVSSATTKGGAGQGNAQIPLPAIATTGRKLTIVLKGGTGSDTFAHWQQTVGQVANATIRSTLTGQTLDGTWGAPSVIGGPTKGDYASDTVFTNLRIVVDGLNVVAPFNPSLTAFDFGKVAQMHIINAGAFANAGPAGSPALTTLPTNDLGLGLRAPRNANNADATVVAFACEGFYTGVVIGEHFTALRLLCVYANDAIFVQGGDVTTHGAVITYACVEAVVNAITVAGTAGAAFPLHVGLLDIEYLSGYDINDPSNYLTGTVHWVNSWPSAHPTPAVNGASKVKLVSLHPDHIPGAKTSPAVPATTVAHTNTFWRDCAVTVYSGTVTVIAVAGATTGITSGTVIVPSGKTITLTYSVAPSWTWIAL